MFFPSDYVPFSETEDSGKDDRYLNIGSIPKNKEVLIRLFGPSITGWQWFTEENGKTSSHFAPLHQYPGKHPPGIKKNFKGDKLDTPKRVTSCLIYNATEEKFQICKFDRATVIKEIEKIILPAEGYEEDHPYKFLPVEGTEFTVANFGLVIKKSGEGLETEYTVKPVMRRAATALLETLQSMNPQPYLPALFLSEDPWLGQGDKELTPVLPSMVQDEDGADHEVNF